MKGQRCTGWALHSGIFVSGLLWLFSTTVSAPVVAQSSAGRLTRVAAPRYDVVALRVEFQPDSSRFSSGDGTFGGALFADTDPPKIDPLPHDAEYFRAHLSFLQHYIGRVSDGRTVIETHLLPSIVRVSGTMGHYAPTGMDSGTDAELAKLASLVAEAWSGVTDSLPEGLDPERTAFILFHAGVGRDIELLGTTLDKTPEDLPSLFFDHRSLDRLLGSFDVMIDGFPVSNTLVIPRTETRRGTDFIQNTGFLAEFSINGMLAASFLNYLGVPDLFDTISGKSAIGPFGVMDGLGIFAYSGLLPPEPSAWTKSFLGWSDTIVLSGLDPETVELRHSGDALANDALIVPVSAGEYFLVENRNRDPEGDGVSLQVWNEGIVTDVHFDNGADDFNSSTVSGFPGGVVVNADNFDFALPGGKDDQGTILNGGLLIWHIDERRLAAGLVDNQVNADPDARSIDLEEADGAQDLGFPGAGLFGPAFDVGSPFDFYYQDNPVSVITATGSEIRLYENRFGPDTTPDSRSNGGGASFVDLSGFSLPGPVMNVTYTRISEDGIVVLPEFGRDLSAVFTATDAVVGPAFSKPDLSAASIRFFGQGGFEYLVFGVSPDGVGHAVLTRPTSLGGDVRLDHLLSTPPVIVGDRIIAAAVEGFRTIRSDGTEGFLSSGFPSTLQIISPLSPVIALPDGSVHLAVKALRGDLLLSVRDGLLDILALDGLRSVAATDASELIFVRDDGTDIEGVATSGTGVTSSWSYSRLVSSDPIQASFGVDRDGLIGVVPDPDAGLINVLESDSRVVTVDVSSYAPGRLSGQPVLVDLDADGLLDVILTVGPNLLAFDRAGAMIAGFPVPLRWEAVGQPVVADVAGSGQLSILVSAADGRIDAYDTENMGRLVPGFPLSVGKRANASPTLEGGRLAGISADGSLKVWQIDALGAVSREASDGPGNINFTRLTAIHLPTVKSGLIDRAETYNWPNPVREGMTRFRVLVSSPGDIQIKIVDMSGNLVDVLERSGVVGGIPVEIPWKTSAGSGVYFARITVHAANGASETTLVKLAVIK